MSRRAPTNATKVVEIPHGTRLARVAAILGAIRGACPTVEEERRHSVVSLADGSIAVYRHWSQLS